MPEPFSVGPPADLLEFAIEVWGRKYYEEYYPALAEWHDKYSDDYLDSTLTNEQWKKKHEKK